MPLVAGCQVASLKAGRVQPRPREPFVGTKTRAAAAPAISASTRGTMAAGSGKFSAPGVPPSCALARQFSAGPLDAIGLIFANDAPEPSAAGGPGSLSLV